MIKEFNSLLAALDAEKQKSPWISPLAQIWRDMPKEKKIFTNELLSALTDSLTVSDEHRLNQLLGIAMMDGLDTRFVPIFCRLLTVHWHRSHEDLVDMLGEIADEQAVDCVYKTALDVPPYDEGRALARKCIWALKDIGTSDAFDRLKLLAQSEDPIIKETAMLNL